MPEQQLMEPPTTVPHTSPALGWPKKNAVSFRCTRGANPGSTAALEKLREHSWPGNVRELSNRVKQAMVMSMGKVVDIDVLSLCSDGVSETKYPTFKQVKAEFKCSYVTRCLQNVRKRSKKFLLFDEKTRNPAGRLSILIA
ncbi:MAG: hypothetical protein O7F16_12970 [Acidobacteria bacterium]|nr:hypothetical protein [Acidobacteriota bacterium]